MRTTRLVTALLISIGTGAVGAGAVSAPAQSMQPPAVRPAAQAVADIPVSFRVQNINRSDVPCASDGRTYTVRGRIVGPADDIRARRIGAATMYLHGLSFGEFFWDFRQAKGYDYAHEQATRGQVSVVIDRLGYGSSDKVDGNAVCVGSRADMTHQMVQQLRSGDYQTSPSGRTPKVRDVYLAGHSYGGQIAQVEAYSFGDIAGLVVIGYSDRVQSDVLKASAAYAAGVCATGGVPVGGGGPTGYAPFGPPSGAAAALFNSARPRVRQAGLTQLTVDPCGDTASFAAATEIDLARIGSVRVPVLVVGGGQDALFPKPAARDQVSLFTGSRDVTGRTLARTAHAFTLEQSHQQFANVVRRWLQEQQRGR